MQEIGIQTLGCAEPETVVCCRWARRSAQASSPYRRATHLAIGDKAEEVAPEYKDIPQKGNFGTL